MAKDKEYNKDSHDAEAILAYYLVDKPFQTLLPAVAYKLSPTISVV